MLLWGASVVSAVSGYISSVQIKPLTFHSHIIANYITYKLLQKIRIVIFIFYIILYNKTGILHHIMPKIASINPPQHCHFIISLKTITVMTTNHCGTYFITLYNCITSVRPWVDSDRWRTYRYSSLDDTEVTVQLLVSCRPMLNLHSSFSSLVW